LAGTSCHRTALNQKELPVAIDHRPEGQQGTPSAAPAPTTISARGAARRRFTRAGLGATGVLLTLTSQPGMAHDICVPPSAAMSGKLKPAVSGGAHTPICQAKDPDYWKASKSWPCSSDLPFKTVFYCGQKHSETYAKCSLMSVLSPHPEFDNTLGRLLTATYLNAKSGRIPFLKADRVTDIWDQLQSKGYYSPAPNMRWNEADIVLYLAGTMDLPHLPFYRW
jgi:hypothetical protein